MTTNSKSWFTKAIPIFISLIFCILSIVIPNTILTDTKSTTDVFIGKTVVWLVVWTIPQLVIAFMVLIKRRNGYVYAMFLSGFISIMLLVVIPSRYDLKLASESITTILFLIGALYSAITMLSFYQLKITRK